MNQFLSYVWAGMYLLCIGLGKLPNVEGLGKAALVVVAVLFFLPPGLLLYNGLRFQNKTLVKRIRRLCILSLSLTTLCLVAFFVIYILFAAQLVAPIAVNIIYYVLLVVSSPLFCGQYFFLSLFLWALLLFATFIKTPKKEV